MIASEPTVPGPTRSSARVPIAAGWMAAMSVAPADAATRPPEAPGPTRAPDHGAAAWLVPPDGAEWLPATVPGTAASVLRAAGRLPDGAAGPDLDETDWWFRTAFDAEPAGPGEQVLLRVGGIATIGVVVLNGEPVGAVSSMYEELTIDVGDRLRGRNELMIACAALGPELRRPRKPRARWRSRIVKDGALRWFRTTVLGRAPGFAPGPAPVGPWRPIELERRRGVAIDDVRLRVRVDDHGTGSLALAARIRALDGQRIDRAVVRIEGPNGGFEAPLEHPAGVGSSEVRDDEAFTGQVTIPDVVRWWPHTHGEPARHAVSVMVETATTRLEEVAGSIGFRTIAAGPAGREARLDGLDLRVNGLPVFARGAVWTPADPALLSADEVTLRTILEQVRDAGLNMLRIPGIGVYEDGTFHDLCDELGILVWQDLAFANLDYPFADPSFHDTCVREVDALAARIGWRPSLAVVCGNSEIEQQVSMLGLSAELGPAPFFATELPARLQLAGCDAIVVPSTPTGGLRPFQTDAGIANYYGVGGYRRPLADVRRADVRFAAECLAFSNVPDDAALADLGPSGGAGTGGAVVVGNPAWKAGIPRDHGSSWDFEDVRDHYLGELYGVDPGELRSTDPARYLELGRLVTGEVMAEVFGEWRRAGSRSGGGLVLWLRDQRPGAGWGVLDHRGAPKAAWHHLRRALAPIAVWTTDEGLNGIRIHVANDRPGPLEARLRVTAYQDDELLVDEASEDLHVDAATTIERDVEAMLGRFVDIGWSYRFGPAVRTLIVASLETTPGAATDDAASSELLSQAFRFPLGRPAGALPAARVGLTGRLRIEADGGAVATIASTRYAHGVRLTVPGFVAADDAFGLEPGRPRRIHLRRADAGGTFGGPTVTAANVVGRVALTIEDPR
jgi:beta-mannosidase